MSPKSRGRPPGRGRPTKRQRPPVRPLAPIDQVLREAWRLRECDLLSAQIIASRWLGAAWRARTLDRRDAERDLVREVVAATGGDRAEAAYLALHAFATIPDEAWRADVVQAVESAPPGLAPAWTVDPATHVPEPAIGARRWADPWGSEVVYLIRFAEPADHSLIVALTTVGGVWVHLMEVGIQQDEPARVLGDLTMADVEPDEALAAVADALEQTDLYWPPQDDPDYALTRALAHWRTQGHRREVVREALPDDDRRRLIDDFLALPRGDVDPVILEVLADTFIDFGDGYLHGSVLAWSPGEVERFMLDWVHRKVLLDPDCLAALPAVLATWVEFALRRSGLAPEHVALVVEEVAALEKPYRDAVADSSYGGPANAIMTRLVAEGVDLSDRDAVDDVVRAYNAEQLARRLLEP